MKNLSKVLAVVLAFAMALSMVSFAAFTDIEAGDNCEEAVTVLSSLGILSGYTDGTFKPENTITRAEFASVVIRMLGFGDIASGGSVVFTDVPADHWANGVIALAAHQGIIAGYGDGRFGPEDPVNYEQAIAMVVRALGYTPMADANGGYPGGYQVVASQKGLLNGTSGAPGLPANRGTVAQFVYNSLTIPMMEQVVYGTTTNYMPVKKLILNLHNVTKLEGNVHNTAASSNDVKAGEVEVKYLAQISAPTENEALAVRYDSSDKDAYPYVKNINTGVAVTLKVAPAVEESAKELMDVASIMFVKNADNSKADELLCVLKDSTKNAIEEFPVEDMAADAAVADNASTTVDKIKVYTDKDAGEYEEYEVALSKIYVNDRLHTEHEALKSLEKFEVLNKYLKKNSGNVDVKLLANTDDEDLFTIAYITAWTDAIVESVSEKAWKVYTKDSATLKLDESDKDKKFVIYKDGEIASFEDIQPNDVLSYYGDLKADADKPYGVVHIVSDKVEGKVTGTTKKSVIVDGVSYPATSEVVTAVESKMGNSFVFYLNARGIIIGEDKTESKGNLKYGFASYFYHNADTEQSSVKLLTSDGVWTTIECPAKFALNGNSKNESDVKWITDEGYVKAKDSNTRYAVNAVVAYELTADGEIAKLYTKENKDIFESKDANAAPGSASDKDDKKAFVATTGRIGAYELNDSTIIFNIDYDAEFDSLNPIKDKDVSVVSLSTLLDRADYNVMRGYNMDGDTGIWAALYGYDIVSDINWASDFFVVSSDPIQTTNEDGDKGYYFTGLQGGEEVTLFVNTDEVNGIAKEDVVEITAYANNSDDAVDKTEAELAVKDIAKGDVLLYGLTATGEAAKVVRLVDASDLYVATAGKMGMVKDALSDGDSSVLTTFKVGDTEFKFVFGYAVKRSESKLSLVNTNDTYDATNEVFVTADEYRFAEGVLGAAYDKSIGETGRTTEAAYGDISLDRFFAQYDAESNYIGEKSGDLVFARVENSYTITDFAVIRNYED